MKLINERGKLFGLINLVDLVLLLVIVLAVAAFGYKALNKPIQEITSEVTPATVTLRVRGAMPYLTDELLDKVHPGDRLVSGSSYDNAEVVSLEVTPHVYSTLNEDCVAVEVTDPHKSDIMITVKTSGVENNPVFKIGSQEVRIGRTFTFKTNRCEIVATIESVEFDG